MSVDISYEVQILLAGIAVLLVGLFYLLWLRKVEKRRFSTCIFEEVQALPLKFEPYAPIRLRKLLGTVGRKLSTECGESEFSLTFGGIFLTTEMYLLPVAGGETPGDITSDEYDLLRRSAEEAVHNIEAGNCGEAFRRLCDLLLASFSIQTKRLEHRIAEAQMRREDVVPQFVADLDIFIEELKAEARARKPERTRLRKRKWDDLAITGNVPEIIVFSAWYEFFLLTYGQLLRYRKGLFSMRREFKKISRLVRLYKDAVQSGNSSDQLVAISALTGKTIRFRRNIRRGIQ